MSICAEILQFFVFASNIQSSCEHRTFFARFKKNSNNCFAWQRYGIRSNCGGGYGKMRLLKQVHVAASKCNECSTFSKEIINNKWEPRTPYLTPHSTAVESNQFGKIERTQLSGVNFIHHPLLDVECEHESIAKKIVVPLFSEKGKNGIINYFRVSSIE